MNKILIVSGHTDLNYSVANKGILEELSNKLPEAEFDNLSELYPDFKIDVEKEQNKLLNADIIVLQYPVFWYSIPSLLKRWIEQVFQYGFAYGSTGDKLKGKKIILSFTSGVPEEAYTKEGVGYNMEELIAYIKATFVLCQLDLVGMVWTSGVSIEMRNDPLKMREKVVMHCGMLLDLIEGL